MPCWNSRRAGRKPTALLILIFLTMLATTAGAAERSWRWSPWLGLSGGHESDLVLDPDVAREVVPGGAFFQLSPGFVLTRPLSDHSGLRVLNRNDMQRFVGDGDRTLLSSAALADLWLRAGSGLEGRITLNGDVYDDSARPTVRRWSGGARAGVGFSHRRWFGEVSGYVQERRYPDLALADGGAYDERHRGVGVHLAWRAAGDLRLDLRYDGRLTDAALPAYDSASHTATAGLEYGAGARTWLTAAVTGQWRAFDDRPDGEDDDSYRQFGLALIHDLGPALRLTTRYARATYTDPLGGDQTTDRMAAGVTWRFGGGGSLASAVVDVPRSAGRGSHHVGEPVRFRIHAPGAATVSVAGSFNGWDPAATPLHPAGDGWWERSFILPVGHHEYVYMVDGEARLPADAARTVADGFGGRNAVLEIQPAGR